MSASGDSAELIVKMVLEEGESILKLSGKGAEYLLKELIELSKGNRKNAGPVKIQSMLKSGKEVKMYRFENKDYETLKKASSKYGIAYTAILGKEENMDGTFDVMVTKCDVEKLLSAMDKYHFHDLKFQDGHEIRERKDHSPLENGKEKEENDHSTSLLDSLLVENMEHTNKQEIQPNAKEEKEVENPTEALAIGKDTNQHKEENSLLEGQKKGTFPLRKALKEEKDTVTRISLYADVKKKKKERELLKRTQELSREQRGESSL